MAALDQLKRAGNSLFVVEHDLETMRRADWLVDVGPGAGEHGGQVLYSGPPAGLAAIEASVTRRYLFESGGRRVAADAREALQAGSNCVAITRNNLKGVDARFPLAYADGGDRGVGVGQDESGRPGAGRTRLRAARARAADDLEAEAGEDPDATSAGPRRSATPSGGRIVSGLEGIRRLVRVDQRPIGRTPRSNLATYTGLFDGVRRLFAATPQARARHFDAGRFSFNVAKGRCPTCEGEGSVGVELLFLPSVYAPCPTCHGARYNEQTLKVRWQGRNIAEVLRMSVEEACQFFADEASVLKPLAPAARHRTRLSAARPAGDRAFRR